IRELYVVIIRKIKNIQALIKNASRRGSAENRRANKVSGASIELSEALIYKLSSKLGGRDSVVNAPFVELLSYLISKLEEEETEALKEEYEYYMQFVALLHSNPQDEKEAKRTNEFMKSIVPKDRRKDGNRINEKPQWNERVQRKIEERKKKNKEQ